MVTFIFSIAMLRVSVWPQRALFRFIVTRSDFQKLAECCMRLNSLGHRIGSLFALTSSGSGAHFPAMPANYVFKPTAVPSLRFNQSLPRGGGLTRR